MPPRPVDLLGQLERVEHAHGVLVRQKDQIAQLEHRLRRSTSALEKQTARSDSLSQRCVSLENANAKLVRRLQDCEAAFNTQSSDLEHCKARLASTKQDLGNALSQEEKARARIRQLEHHSSDLLAKHDVGTNRMGELARENATLASKLHLVERAYEEQQADHAARMHVLQTELKEKTCQVFELSNAVRGLEYKMERDKQQSEREWTGRLAQATDLAREAHLVVEQREAKALKLLRQAQDWRQRRHRVEHSLSVMCTSRQWAFAMLDVVVQQQEGGRGGAGRAKFRRAALAVLFCCVLRRRAAADGGEDATTAAVSSSWRAQDVLLASQRTLTVKVASTRRDLALVDALQQEAVEYKAKLAECEAHTAQLDAVTQAHAEAGELNAQLQSKLSKLRHELKRLTHERQAERARQEEEATDSQLVAQALQECQLALQAQRDQFHAKLAKHQAKLRHCTGLLAEEQDLVQQQQAQLRDVQLELDTAREMLGRTQRYAEAEIKSLSGVIAAASIKARA